MKILISRGNLQNAKSYPFWEEFLALIPEHEVKEIKGILSEKEIIDLINWSNIWVSVDSFIPHLCAYHHLKRGIVIWGKSNPNIFGYKNNINLLKDPKNLRPDQFRWWNDQKHDPEDFVSADVLVTTLKELVL